MQTSKPAFTFLNKNFIKLVLTISSNEELEELHSIFSQTLEPEFKEWEGIWTLVFETIEEVQQDRYYAQCDKQEGQG